VLFRSVTAYSSTRVESDNVSATVVNDNVVSGKESWFSQEFTATSNGGGGDDGGGSSDFWWLSLLGLSIALRRLTRRKDTSYS